MNRVRETIGRTLSRVARAVFVIPDVQVHQLDLEYQFYAFHLFHRSTTNRLLHAVGLPLTIAAVYAVLQPWPPVAAAALAWVTGLQLLLAVRHRLLVLVPPVVAINAGLWLAATRLLQPLDLSPALPLIAAAIPYSGHAIEPWVPPPYSASGTFVRWRDWLAQSAHARMALGALCAPAHVLVEVLSAPRNIVVLLVIAMRTLGLAGSAIHALDARVARLIAAPRPPLTRDEYRSAVLGPGA